MQLAPYLYRGISTRCLTRALSGQYFSTAHLSFAQAGQVRLCALQQRLQAPGAIHTAAPLAPAARQAHVVGNRPQALGLASRPGLASRLLPPGKQRAVHSSGRSTPVQSYSTSATSEDCTIIGAKSPKALVKDTIGWLSTLLDPHRDFTQD